MEKWEPLLGGAGAGGYLEKWRIFIPGSRKWAPASFDESHLPKILLLFEAEGQGAGKALGVRGELSSTIDFWLEMLNVL